MKNVKMNIDYLFQFYAQCHPPYPFQSYQNLFEKIYLREFQISLPLVLFSYQKYILRSNPLKSTRDLNETTLLQNLVIP